MTKRPIGRPAEPYATSPLYPDKVRRVVRLRDQGLTLKAVGEDAEVSMTKVGVRLCYNRWKKWAYENPEV